MKQNNEKFAWKRRVYKVEIEVKHTKKSNNLIPNEVWDTREIIEPNTTHRNFIAFRYFVLWIQKVLFLLLIFSLRSHANFSGVSFILSINDFYMENLLWKFHHDQPKLKPLDIVSIQSQHIDRNSNWDVFWTADEFFCSSIR